MNQIKKAKLMGLVSFAIFSLAGSIVHAEGVSKFKLLNPKCVAEESGKLETAPQSPPLDVDDPGTPGCNNWEINILADGDLSSSEKTWELPLLDINYGIGDNLQLKYEVPFVESHSDEASNVGVGSARAGVKDRFYEDEENGLALAIYPQVDFVMQNSGAIDNGLATEGTVTMIPLILSKKIGETSLGEVMLTANLAYNISSKQDTTDFVSAAAGVGLPISRKLVLMGELSTEQATAKNSEDVRDQLVKANVGVLSPLGKNFLAYASAGQSLYSSDLEAHSYLLTGVRILTE